MAVLVDGGRAGPCRSCGSRRGRFPRGLCWRCYHDPEIRERFPPVGDHSRTRRGVKVENAEGPVPVGGPTDSVPGSLGRILAMEERAARGESLWHPDDRPADDDGPGVPASVLLSKPVGKEAVQVMRAAARGARDTDGRGRRDPGSQRSRAGVYGDPPLEGDDGTDDEPGGEGSDTGDDQVGNGDKDGGGPIGDAVDPDGKPPVRDRYTVGTLRRRKRAEHPRPGIAALGREAEVRRLASRAANVDHGGR